MQVKRNATIKNMGGRASDGNGRPYSILKEDQLLDIIRKFQEVLIETVKIRFEQPILNDSILLEL